MDSIRIVLVSPGEVEPERQAVEKAIASLRPMGQECNTTFFLLRWEDIGPCFDLTSGQPDIEKYLAIENADLVIGVFWRRFVTLLPNGVSRTVQEIEHGLAAKRTAGKKPEVKVFFCNRSYYTDQPDVHDQHAKVLRYKRE